MKLLTCALLVTLAASTVRADTPATPAPVPAPVADPFKIIEQEGELAFTDGSSSYLFSKDGTFKSWPVFMSGREIAGTWKRQKYDNAIVVQGKWGWVNGLSAAHDYRRMVMYVSSPRLPKTTEFAWAGVHKYYSCYFVIEELKSIPSLDEETVAPAATAPKP